MTKKKTKSSDKPTLSGLNKKADELLQLHKLQGILLNHLKKELSKFKNS